MGGLTAQNSNRDIPKISSSVVDRLMAQPVLPDLVELPLVTVHGTFRCLEQLQVTELEDFLRYLSKYTAGKEQRSRFSRPVWWYDDVIPFSVQFAKGSSLSLAENKQAKMMELVTHAYRHYSSSELLKLSTKLASIKLQSLQYKTCSDGSVAVVNRAGNVLARIPASNLEYDYEKPRKSSPQVMKQLNIIEVITIDDESPRRATVDNSKIEELATLTSLHNLQTFKLKSILDPVDNVPYAKLYEEAAEKGNTCGADTIVLTDSDDEFSMEKSSIPLTADPFASKSKLAPTDRSKKYEKRNTVRPSPKKRLRLIDRLNDLQKSGSISLYPCITLSESEEDDEDDDCQIIEVSEPVDGTRKHEVFSTITNVFSSFKRKESNVELEPLQEVRLSRRKRIRKQIKEVVEFPPIPEEKKETNPLFEFILKSTVSGEDEGVGVKHPEQEEFLSHLNLIKKDKLEKVEAYVKSNLPRKKLRRLKIPLYHMPLDSLPILVARGIINPSQLEAIAEDKKLRKQKKPTISARKSQPKAKNLNRMKNRKEF